MTQKIKKENRFVIWFQQHHTLFDVNKSTKKRDSTWWNIDDSVAIVSVKTIFAAIFLFVSHYFDMSQLIILDNPVSTY